MLTLSGTVQFANNSFGSSNSSSTAIFLSCNKGSKLSLTIASGAFVHFHNNTSSIQAGAHWLKKTAINIDTGATVMFSDNKAIKSWGATT